MSGAGLLDFDRWVCGDVTRWCGHEYHDRCEGQIVTGPFQAPCLCECHV